MFVTFNTVFFDNLRREMQEIVLNSESTDTLKSSFFC